MHVWVEDRVAGALKRAAIAGTQTTAEDARARAIRSLLMRPIGTKDYSVMHFGIGPGHRTYTVPFHRLPEYSRYRGLIEYAKTEFFGGVVTAMLKAQALTPFEANHMLEAYSVRSTERLAAK